MVYPVCVHEDNIVRKPEGEPVAEQPGPDITPATNIEYAIVTLATPGCLLLGEAFVVLQDIEQAIEDADGAEKDRYVKHLPKVKAAINVFLEAEPKLLEATKPLAELLMEDIPVERRAELSLEEPKEEPET